ncbi:carboxymuconolactone decarboxylase family protein [Haladaptatus halobius]|uniref:carboxymuconolactone decarboxylase family protein n=1 Tax=Haladaptatus halobius TaxID=2884875 RepID=UPI001D09DD1A|nr:carboxymuconolactone decarboxylase family protein [Haladaptatus halobius]
MDDHVPRVSAITNREEIPEGHRHNFDLIEESRGQVSGPFTVLLNSPEVGGRVGHLGTYIRFESQLSGQERELAILTTAREFDCAYEWAVHEPLAREAGVRDEALKVVTDRRSVDALTETEAIIVRYGRALLRDHEVPEALFRTAKDYFGVQGITDLTATIGYYSLLACVLNAFDVTPDEGT